MNAPRLRRTKGRRVPVRVRTLLCAGPGYDRPVRRPTDLSGPMTASETLPELIHRLVEEKGRQWVQRELGYGPDVIAQHLAAYERALARRAPLSGQPTPPERVERQPQRLTDLALYLRVRRDTLSRALRRDPAAPAPVPGGPPHRWSYAEVYAWWPQRRGRGRPTGEPAAPRTPQDPA
ncbi:hypothetical protein ACIG3E_33335 [Streptomyces sp. NPDC053474]|uniref:hypothetical protein n=1 Tax=Streptomyces sp. NPDC053474 TaxID=3365704 RepID=UPI0037D90826